MHMQDIKPVVSNPIPTILIDLKKRLDGCTGLSEDWRSDVLICRYTLSNTVANYCSNKNAEIAAALGACHAALGHALEQMKASDVDKALEYVTEAQRQLQLARDKSDGISPQLAEAETLELDSDDWASQLAAAKAGLYHE